MRLPTPDRRRATAGVLSSLLLILALAVPAAAQSPSPDADLRALPTQVIRPNDRSGARPAYVVTSRIPAFTGHVRFEDSGGGPCDLIVRAGGHVSFEDSFVELVGDLLLEDGGVARMVDTEFELQSRYPREFNFDWSGGWLDTRRVAIGGRMQGGMIANFRLYKGLWTARDTVVRMSGGILLGILGADPTSLGGGTLIADGLYSGVRADAIHMDGRSNASLRNSHFAIALGLYDPGRSVPAIELDVPTSPLDHRVYGDPAVHEGVTHPIAGSPHRLELVKSSVARWFVKLNDAGPRATPRVYRITGEDPLTVGIRATDLTGEPVLVGPWANHLSTVGSLPALPSVREPGHHPIPPGCGVTVGAVTVESGPANWTAVSVWDLYLKGPATDFAVRGAARIGEVMVGAGRLVLEGRKQYDLGLTATTVSVHTNGRLVVRGAAVGTEGDSRGEVLACGEGVCVLEDVKLRNILLRTGAQPYLGTHHLRDEGSIVMRRAIPATNSDERLTLRESRAGSIVIEEAGPSQSFDLQNLDFESGVRADGLPEYWHGTGVSGRAQSSVKAALASRSASAYRYTASASDGFIAKTIQVEPGALVELHGHFLVAAANGGERVEFAIEGSSGRRASAVAALSATGWQSFHVPSYRVGNDDTHITLKVGHQRATPGGLSVSLDQFDARISTYWEYDNLVNLDFEEPLVRGSAESTNGSIAPDFWKAFGCTASIQAGDARPGSSGSRCVRLEATRTEVSLMKQLRFLSPGQTVTFAGWVKWSTTASSPAALWVFVGEGPRFWDPSHGNHVRQQLTPNSGWRYFTVSYVVPDAPYKDEYTSFAIDGGEAGDSVLVDDVELIIR